MSINFLCLPREPEPEAADRQPWDRRDEAEEPGHRQGLWEEPGGSVGPAVPSVLSLGPDTARGIHGGCQVVTVPRRKPAAGTLTTLFIPPHLWNEGAPGAELQGHKPPRQDAGFPAPMPLRRGPPSPAPHSAGPRGEARPGRAAFSLSLCSFVLSGDLAHLDTQPGGHADLVLGSLQPPVTICQGPHLLPADPGATSLLPAQPGLQAQKLEAEQGGCP